MTHALKAAGQRFNARQDKQMPPPVLIAATIGDLRNLRALVALAPREVALNFIDKQIVAYQEIFHDFADAERDMLGGCEDFIGEVTMPVGLGGATDNEALAIMAEARAGHAAAQDCAECGLDALRDMLVQAFGEPPCEAAAATAAPEQTKFARVDVRMLSRALNEPKPVELRFECVLGDEREATALVGYCLEEGGLTIAEGIAQAITLAAKNGQTCGVVVPQAAAQIAGIRVAKARDQVADAPGKRAA